MELKDFICNFASQFEETDTNKFAPHTKFKDLAEWSSLVALSVMAMVDEKYKVAVRGDFFRQSNTIEELFLIIKQYDI